MMRVGEVAQMGETSGPGIGIEKMNFRTVGELRGGRGDHPSEEALAKPVKEPDVVLTPPAIDTSERQTPLLARTSLP
jgi:hypothetical protein